MPCSWPGPGGERDEPPDYGCDGDCSDCQRECEVRGEECRDADNCRGCTAKGWCSAAINDEEEEE